MDLHDTDVVQQHRRIMGPSVRNERGEDSGSARWVVPGHIIACLQAYYSFYRIRVEICSRARNKMQMLLLSKLSINENICSI